MLSCWRPRGAAPRNMAPMVPFGEVTAWGVSQVDDCGSPKSQRGPLSNVFSSWARWDGACLGIESSPGGDGVGGAGSSAPKGPNVEP